jgi:ABC-type transport system involved in multi-copper enzyme maturation permease subunit
MVSRELEGRTYELLIITPVRGRTVVFGKLFAALGYIFFMVISALPLACIVFIFGGVTLENILLGFGVTLMTAVTYGIVGIFFSALVKRTGLAVMLTYSVVALMLVGSWLVSNSISASLNSELSRLPSGVARPDPRLDPSFDLPKRILVVNPVAAVGSILARNAPYRGGTSEDLQLFPNSKFYGGNPSNYYSNSSNNPQLNAATRQPVLPGGIPLWGGYFLVYIALSLFFFLLSLLVVKPGVRRGKPSHLKSN